ncbi:MAG TPA: 2-isopropylmalate synthase [Gammaproteobacteria bacterium]|jgi:2-isopropylmalate synthase|nr:2-isopropylmalate synthase [Gammaproteobacteria bacterium]OUX33717.1 MAG: 2-isopropylmalate synthase [Gammaproteobacteria bacterium TMED260]HBP98898.1 2-isopropylmalate synthase [Gammaproteobacteria bacterium]HCI88669.1 2-isopropylmalate synthase [Gammaproteobacteria bacterium]|tara:strand:- start:9259 stop:10935 length:1677 start_codon:yes stop_codon:yes gene_type:complete
MSGNRFDYTKYKPFQPIALADRTWPDQVITEAPTWCSVDLRDGNQALIEPMSVEQKKKLFGLLVEVGFKEIEVGFPAASQPDFDFVRCLIEENRIPDDVTVQVLTQARPELIQRTFESLRGARRAVLHVYNSTSTVQREKVFKTDKAGIIDIAVAGAREVKRCAEAAPETEWVFQYSPESFTGTEMDFAVEVCDAVNDVWQPTNEKPSILNLPATVEMATPNVYADQIEYFCRSIKNRDAVIISLHTHNDRASAVAAAELAVMAGAQRVEGTLLGNGERTGNMDIVIMAMNLYSQGIDPCLDLHDMDRIVSVVRECTQIDVHPRQAYSGDLVFTAFSGSHQDAIKKCLDIYEEGSPWEIAYLPIDPRDIGRTYQDVIRVNSQSGKGGVAYVLANKFGFQLPRWLQIEFSRVVQKVTEDTGQEISPDQIWELFNRHYLNSDKVLSLEDFTIAKHEGRETFDAKLNYFEKELAINGEGDGVLDAFVEGMKSAIKLDLEIMEYGEHALGQGADAEAVTYIQIRCEGQRYSGVAISKDIIASSLNAFMGAASQLLSEQSVAA